jgi:uncharacterized protein YtpQ (UPF0354 family)
MKSNELDELDAASIVPLIKAAIPENDHASAIELNGEDALVDDPFVANLFIMYAFDLPSLFRFVARRDLERLGISSEGLRELAVSNLRRVLPEIECHGEPPVFMLTVGGNLEASLLLIDDLWESLCGLVAGELVAAVPARDVLMFTGNESVEGIAAIRNSIERIWNGGDHLISKSLLVWRDRRWLKFEDNSIWIN